MKPTLANTFLGSGKTRVGSGRARRGVAMVIVLCVVATSVILATAMLSSSQLATQVGDNATEAVQSRYLAESGASLALYYLRYPEKAPSLTEGEAGNVHYAGQQGLELWGDGSSVNIRVSNPSVDEFEVSSSSRMPDGGSATVRTRARLVTSAPYAVRSAVMANGDLQLPPQSVVEGGVVASGTFDAGGATVSGDTTNLGDTSTPVTASMSSIALVAQTSSANADAQGRRTYRWNGGTYVAQPLPATTTGTLMPDYAVNPAGVWVTDGNVTLRDAVITGTLVLRSTGSVLKVTGNCVVSPVNGSRMPAVVSGQLDMSASMLKPSKLTANGVVWVNDSIKNTGYMTQSGGLFITGGLLLGSSRRDSFSTSVKCPIQVKYDADKARLDGFSTDPDTVSDLRVGEWQLVRN
jgi:hypothetical protein